MADINNGGPAFPKPHDPWPNTNGSTDPSPTGMSLRDYFAAKALTGIVGPNYEWFTGDTDKGSRVHEAAYFAYSLADAMIAARKTSQGAS